jgi:rubrerythrin
MTKEKGPAQSKDKDTEEKGKNDKEKETGADPVDIPTRKVIHEIVMKEADKKIAETKDKDGDKDKSNNPKKKPEKKDGDEKLTVEELQEQLTEMSKARKEAEEELETLKETHGTTTDELEKQKSIVTAYALKEFEDKKKLLLDQIEDEEKREEVAELIQSGEDLERVEQMLKVIGSPFKKPTDGTGNTGTGTAGATDAGKSTDQGKKKPKGQAKLQIAGSTDGETWDSIEEMVNDVYDNLEKQLFLKEMGLPFDQKKLEKYQGMANKLLHSLIKGEQNREKITKWKVVQCRHCGKILLKIPADQKCPECGGTVSASQEVGAK